MEEKRVNKILADPMWCKNGDGKITFAEYRGTTPWIYFKSDPERRCIYWLAAYFEHFGVIPDFCRNRCWKVAIRPDTLSGLFGLSDILEKSGFMCKCGMDLRDYTFGPWAGFIYTNSLDEAHKIVSSYITPLPTVIKKGCTEMEERIPSTEWEATEAADQTREHDLNEFFDLEKKFNCSIYWHEQQNDKLKHEIKVEWIKHAIAIGDRTVKKVVTGFFDDPNYWDKLVVQSVNY
ncbi:hypothetical protein LCGC14_0864540 [marine sediment metagenome]|uniref:Uncharacterized protein n=1 Tax=marine sediment metagenome TaxID=412755 RepID=A0A0F9PBE4_9ZZZZ